MKLQRKNRIKCYMFCLMTVLLLSVTGKIPVSVHAAGATVTFSADNKSVAVGDTFYVIVIVDSADYIGGFEGYLSYNSDLAEFVEGGSFVNGSSGLLRIYDMDSTDSVNTKKYSLQFKAKKTGDCIFDTSDVPAVYNADGEELSVSSNMLTVSISNSSSLSSNNNLSRLLVSPGQLNQEFQNDITAYKTEIPYESDMLFISAEPEEADATVTVEGNEGLKVGTNYVHVVVTAPSGAKKDIQIEVVRKQEGPEEENQDLEDVQTGVTISGEEENGKVLTVTHQYHIAEPKNALEIPEGYEESNIKINSEIVKAYIINDDIENQFVLLYLTNENGETDFYQYDRIEKTIQRYQPSALKGTDAEENSLSKENQSSFIIIAAMAGVILILSIVLAATAMKLRNEREKEDTRDIDIEL